MVFELKDYNFLSYLSSNKIESSEALVHWENNTSSSELVQASLTYSGSQQFFILGFNSFNRKNFKNIDIKRPVYFIIPKFFTGPYLPDFYEYKKLIMRFRKDFKSQFGRKPSIFAARSVDAIKILSSAIFQSSGERKFTLEYLKNIRKFNGLTGNFDFSKNNNYLIGNSYSIIHFQNGLWNLESFE